ncbi:PAS domain S-box protein [Caulobacter sp. 17J80-11]|uniref:PAS domain S-box protein n=1 Tax=Caulobacter sp. 17J80-11 TaxID=2763502 RepID=UPI001653CE37|nr:PAS domain S-box protein [Caulobacter sp. 17J80-11]MBC6982742.1 PAS domain S-box protein [Caulobacter sp. 17J80-11]
MLSKRRSVRARAEPEMGAAPPGWPRSRDALARQCFDLAGVVLLAIDADGIVRDINLKGEELLGAPREAIVGRRWIAEFLPEENRRAAEALLADVAAGRREMPAQQEAEVLTADGARRRMVWRSTPLRDRKGRVIGVLNSGEDVTETRAAERELEDTRENLRLAQAAGGVGVWWWDARTDRLHNSEELLRLWGLPPHAELTTEQQFAMMHPADRDRAHAAYTAALNGSGKAYWTDYRVMRDDGGVVWLAARGEVVRDASGRIRGMRGVSFDVTALKTAQMAVVESEQRFGELADTAPMLVWLSRPDKSCYWFNKRWLDLTGQSLGEQLLNDWSQLVHPEDRAEAVATYEGAFDRRETYRMQYRLLSRDGSWRWIDETGAPHYGPDGSFLGYVGAGADVTELKEAVEGWRHSELRFRAFSESTQEVCCWMAEAETGRVSYANPAFEAMFGWPREALYADPEFIARHAHPDDVEAVRAAHAGVRRGERQVLEYRVIRADGEERVLSEGEFPVRDDAGRPLWYGGITRDVTDSRRAEAALRFSEKKLRSFADHAEEVVWLIDAPDRRLDYLNPAYERISGERPEAFLAHVGHWWKLVAPDDRRAVSRAVARALRGEKVRVRFQIVRPDDGGRRAIETAMFPLFDDQNRLRWFGGLSRDVTEAVEQSEALERRVAERTAELEASIEQRHKAEAALAQAQRMETVGRLTGGIAHDFNNLLTVIIGALDMILRKPDPDRVQRLGGAALEAARRGERLARQMLAFSRRQELKLERVDLPGLIARFQPMLRGAVSEATPLTVDVDPDLGAGLVDAGQLEAALLNLVVNAGEAVSDGGEIRMRASRVKLSDGEVPDLPAGDYAVIAVQDTGRGMTAEVAAHAFEPFFTTKEVGKGTGLGLAQVYGLVRQLSGTVTIDSAPGRGTTVRLYVPAAGGVAEAEPAAELEDARPLEKGCSVLLVEDDPGVRQVAEALLQDMGCEVVSAPDGPTALQRLEQAPEVKLLLSDVVMPGGMSGVDLADAVKARRPDLKVILATGYASDRLEGAEGRWPVLHKPYDGRELRAELRRVLR